MTRLRWRLTALLFLLESARVWAGPPLFVPRPVPNARGVVIVLDGAGGFCRSPLTVQQALAEQQVPLTVEAVTWTHGYWRIAADQMHAAHTRAAGHRLAQQILAWKQAHPDQMVFVVAHSAGCGVALFAADQLPPNTLERIILLSPAVSASYNLRWALRSSCQGIDVFYSEQDWACLGIGIALFGTTDRHWTAAAGKVGFRPTLTEPGDEVLFTRLRQYPWNPTLAVTGNDGGHYGGYQLGFLRAFVLPLLLSDCQQPGSPGSLPGHPG